jgi:predicted DNA-binding WGR domain protein
LDERQSFAERLAMADDTRPGSSPLQIVLERIDHSKNLARYYVLSVELILFAKDTLIRRWGRIGSAGRERLQFFDSAGAAELALETWLDRKRKRGYVRESYSFISRGTRLAR